MAPRINAPRLARLVLLLVALVALAAPATAAWAQTDGGDYPASTSTTNPCGNGGCGTTTTIQVKGASTLPFTGGNVALLTVLGLGAAGAGMALVLLGRRSKSTA